jgi:putative ABC transport system permease protein
MTGARAAALGTLATLGGGMALVAAWMLLPWQGCAALAAAVATWLWATATGAQTRALFVIGLGSLPRRAGGATTIVAGIAAVAGVLVALLAMAEGYRNTLRAGGAEDVALVLRTGSAAEVVSLIDRDAVAAVEAAPGVARTAAGDPAVSAELVVAASLPVRGGPGADEAGVPVRGVDARAFDVRPQVRIVEGRRFAAGLRELIVGRGAASLFGLRPGQEIRLGGQPWTVVGLFDSGDALASEIWADAGMLADVYRRGPLRSTATVKLDSPAALEPFRQALAAQPRLPLEVSTTAGYFARQSEGVTQVLTVTGMVVGAIMAAGALFGAVNTMYAAVAARSREIATLRAIGFAGAPVVAAVVLECMLLAALGGVVGALLATLLLDGTQASTVSGLAFGKLAFELEVTAALAGDGLRWALAIGAIGGLPPALRAARTPVGAALRADG